MMESDTFTTPSLSPTSFKSAPGIIPPDEANAIIKRLEEGPSSDDDVTLPTDSKTGLQTPATVGSGGPGIPIRTSSNSQTQTLASSPVQEKTSDEPKAISRRASKESIKEKSRSGSLASRHSKQERPLVSSLASKEKSEAIPQTATTSNSKPKRGFLSFLNCCGASDNANTEATEPAVPPRKANVLQAPRSRQPTPLVKSNPGEKDSSASDSKDIPEETIGGKPYEEQTAAKKPVMITRKSKEADLAEKTIPAKTGNTSDKEKAMSGTTYVSSSPSSQEADENGPEVEASKPDPLSSTSESSSAMPPNPPHAIPADESVAAQGEAINDRTAEQEQKDSDIAMTEAPPIAPEVEDSTRSTESQNEERSTQITLPPPPPRDSQARPTAHGDRGGATERQQWLLPPMQPRFQGKKCLVLDLDETLVHSSFKVGKSTHVRMCINTVRFFIKPTLQYLLKLRASIIMCMS